VPPLPPRLGPAARGQPLRAPLPAKGDPGGARGGGMSVAPLMTEEVSRLAGADSFSAEIGGIRAPFGAGVLDLLGPIARTLGGRRILLVTDPGVRAAGHAERAVAFLE